MNLPYLNPVNAFVGALPTKFASLIQTEPVDCQIALIGLPDDTGVKLNNGRPGAIEGPTALRAALLSMGVSQPDGWDWPKVFDAGDVDVVTNDLHETHKRVTESVKSVLDLGLFPIGIGGGHDLTFPFVQAVADHFGPLAGVYFDPHLDVRETDGSGMPFRKLLETGAASSLQILGFDPMSNSQAHTDWFQSNGGTIVDSESKIRWPNEPTFVSLDLDVIDSAHAPGVSAMNPCGWSSQQAAQMVHKAAINPNLKCFDVMELSPPNDDKGRTSRLAARMLLSFLRGFALRQNMDHRP
jgi:formiminoglutamase